jgi:hypothetical protein
MRRRDILRGIAGAACVSVGGTVAFPALADTLECLTSAPMEQISGIT